MFFTNYVNQCNKKGLAPSAAAEEMGFQRSVITRWSKGANPRQATLQKIADYFGCTVEDLTMDNKDATGDILLDSFTYAAHGYSGRLTDADKATIIKMMETLAAANEEDNGQANGGIQ